MFNVHLKEKSTGEARKDSGKKLQRIVGRWNLLLKKITLSSGASPFLNTPSKPFTGIVLPMFKGSYYMQFGGFYKFRNKVI